MEFANRLYTLRKQKGLSQEELASRLDVARQTVSKWEGGDSTPDMDKLIALSELFEVSLDWLVLGKTPAQPAAAVQKQLTPQTRQRLKKGLKLAGIILALLLAVDAVSLAVYFLLFGMPG